MTDTDSPPSWTDAEYCPYCGSTELEDRPKDWEQREYPDEEGDDPEATVYRLHGINKCQDCGGRFETVSEPREFLPQHEEYTLQFVVEDLGNPDDASVTDIQGVKIIAGGEDDASVVAERAKWNMMFGGCSEVQGPEFAVQNLFEFITEHADIDAETEEFDAGRWLFEMNNDGEA